ncbi:MAG: phytanoyl-CoA dioxygenase [Candidatus Latescibacteria bacterium]|nr:phytanoyl-CoA dioxygenase [Candidatus Latescibacterota bacterium]
MDITQALEELGATPDAISQQNRCDLDDKGFTVLPGIIDPEWLASLQHRFEELCQREGPGAGIEVHQEKGTRRLSDLVNKGEMFDLIYSHPKVLACVHHVIGRDFKLSSLNARDALPGDGLQGLHADWGQDYDGCFHVCNSIWLLDDFSLENGCTRLVPGSHLGKNPRNVLKDANAPHPDEEYVVGPAGTVAVFNSQTWHGGTLNRSADLQRRAMHCYFTARENGQQLNQREYLRYETYKRISRAARYILDVDVD